MPQARPPLLREAKRAGRNMEFGDCFFHKRLILTIDKIELA